MSDNDTFCNFVLNIMIRNTLLQLFLKRLNCIGGKSNLNLYLTAPKMGYYYSRPFALILINNIFHTEPLEIKNYFQRLGVLGVLGVLKVFSLIEPFHSAVFLIIPAFCLTFKI